MPSPSKNNTSVALIKLNGTAIREDGTLVPSNYFSYLDLNPDDYSDIVFTPEEARKISAHLQHLSTGSTAAIPLYCGGAARCPFARGCPFILMDQQRRKEYELQKEQDKNQEFPELIEIQPPKPVTPVGRRCHPPGEKILTYEHGYVKIEDLDIEKHRIIGYEKHHNCVRKGRESSGYSFFKSARPYAGTIITLSTESGESYRATKDHICIARFNENAVGKFCVYLMRSGPYWRVGKSQVLGRYEKNNRFGHKTFLGFTGRGNTEKADAMWILGVYDTNTEAALQEDYFSCRLQTSKALFRATSDNISKKKWDGLYRWATQEQLDEHHKKLAKPESFYREELLQLGLSIDYPIWTPNNDTEKRTEEPGDTKIKAKNGMYIRACNILPGIMDIPVYPKEPQRYGKNRATLLWVADWKPVSIQREQYEGPVFSLEVEGPHTYFVNGIATHNCLVEINLLNEWTKLYIQDYEVNPHNFTEFQMVRELAEIELLLWRLNNNISKPENAELVQETVVGVDKQGNTLTRQEVSSVFEAKERLSNRKSKLVKLMVGDRQEKYKKEAATKAITENDPSISAAKLRGEVERLLLKAKKLDKVISSKTPSIEVFEVSNTEVEPSPEDSTLTPEDLISGRDRSGVNK